MFGKWCKPNYNSVVATFCHKISNNFEIKINDKNKKLNLVYIDDLIDNFLSIVSKSRYKNKIYYPNIRPQYKITVGKLANKILNFKKIKDNFLIDNLGYGLTKKLYSTYLTYNIKKNLTIDIQSHNDYRGKFFEFLKSKNNGQFSFFTINSKFTRGNHYHHTKNEKFLVVRGKVLFKFRNILNNDKFSKTFSSSKLQIIKSIPGWAHSLTNISNDDALVILWSNEIFNKNKPDTHNEKV